MIFLHIYFIKKNFFIKTNSLNKEEKKKTYTRGYILYSTNTYLVTKNVWLATMSRTRNKLCYFDKIPHMQIKIVCITIFGSVTLPP